MKRLTVATVIIMLILGGLYRDHAQAQGPEVSESLAAPQSASVGGSGGQQWATFLADRNQVENTSSSTWVDSFKTTVTLSGTSNQCVSIKYSGEASVKTTYFPLSMQFRALVNGNVSNPGAVFFDVIDSGVFTTTGMNWWACNLRPGTHTIQVQFRPFYSGDKAYVRSRTLITEFN